MIAQHVNKNIKTQYILNKNAPYPPNSRDFYDLGTSVAFFLSRFTHFFRRFFETEKHNPQTLSLLECMRGGAVKRSPCTHEMVENHTWVRSKRCIKKVTRRFGGLLPPKFKLALSFAPFSYFRGANSISRLCPCQDKAPGSGTRINHRNQGSGSLAEFAILSSCHPVI